MKPIRFFLVAMITAFGMTACQSISVTTDYDQDADFNQFNTFAFYKPGIDKASISDLDKRRILRAIDSTMAAKGYDKSEDPDVLVSFFTESAKNINVYRNFYGGSWYGSWSPWSWGYSPYWNGVYYNRGYTTTDGILYIDIIDADKNQLIWEGKGTGSLDAKNPKEKVERIQKIVQEILKRYPPGNYNENI